MSNMPVARCEKCGREFLTRGTARPTRDPYGDPYWLPPVGRTQSYTAGEWPACGGRIVELAALSKEQSDAKK